MKKIATMAFAAISVVALAQTGTTGTSSAPMRQDRVDDGRLNSKNIANTDIATTDIYYLRRAVDKQISEYSYADAATLDELLDRLPSYQALVVLRALEGNYKQACIIRNEVAMSRFGSGNTYAWLNNPPLTWGSTPGQNSWSAMADDNAGTPVTMNQAMAEDENVDLTINMTDGSSRPMRMIMSHRGRTDVGYQDTYDILASNLDDHERSVLTSVFTPVFEPILTTTNEAAADVCVRFVEQNSTMLRHLDRYSWYNQQNMTH